MIYLWIDRLSRTIQRRKKTHLVSTQEHKNVPAEKVPVMAADEREAETFICHLMSGPSGM